VSGDQVSIMVDGVQVALPSYEEAVYGSTGNCIPPSDSRVQIVLSEGAGQNGAREMQQQDQGARNSFEREDEDPGHSGLCEASGSQRSETVLVHQAATSSWVAGMASGRPVLKEVQDSESSDIQSLLSLTSSEEYTDGTWLGQGALDETLGRVGPAVDYLGMPLCMSGTRGAFEKTWPSLHGMFHNLDVQAVFNTSC